MGRNAINSAALLAGGLTAHHLGGGAVVNTPHLALLLLLTLIAVFLSNIGEFHPPKVALSVLWAQSVSHIVLGGSTSSTFQMVIFHSIAGFFSYFLIAHSERFWGRVCEFLNLSFIFPSAPNVPLARSVSPRWNSELNFKSFELDYSFLVRGPPSGARIA